jgi:hypothetical protein
MEYGINCSPAQMRKLKAGGAITMKPSNFVDGGVHRIRVMPNTGRRIMTAIKKNKGVRVALKPEEDVVAMTEGGAFSLKSVGKSFSKGAKSVSKGVSQGSKVLKKGFDKTIVDSGVGKQIASNLIDLGTNVVLPAAFTEASMALGDPTGMSGAMAGQLAGKYLNKEAAKGGYGIKGRTRKALINEFNKLKKRMVKAQKLQGGDDYYFSVEGAMRETEEGEDMDEVSIGRFTNAGIMEVIENLKNALEGNEGGGIKKGMRRIGMPRGARLAYDDLEGEGLFKTLHKMGANKIGITKKSVTKVAKDTGKVAVRLGAQAAGEAITAYTGNPEAGATFERIAVGAADRAIDSKRSKDILKNAGKGAAKQAKMIAIEGIDNYIDENLSGAIRKNAEKALASKYPSAKELIYDNEGGIFEGYGMMGRSMLPMRSKGGMRMGRGMAHLTPAYVTAMRSATTGAGFRVADDRVVTPAPNLGLPIQTGSPFARFSSPAMSPYIASSPQLTNIRIGGSFAPAGGTLGGSFYPAGKFGGSFLPA